jgi:ribose/xylose/arabinose/galactoside ABC-type transport system permease subunit
VLALVVVVLMVATAAATSHQNLTSALGEAGYLGLLAAGLAFSLRTRSPNLAVGPILAFSSATSAYFITMHHWSKPVAFLVAVVLSTVIGLVLGVLVAVLSVPAWAASLGAGAVVEAFMLSYSKNVVIPVRFDGSYPTALWYGLFFVVSVGGGALWLVPGLRRPLSAGRAAREPGRWTDPRTSLGAVVGLTGSSFLAGLAAIPMLMRLQAAEASGANLTTLAFAAVLLGGTSVFGRRAGVFGTLLGVTILTVTQTLVAYGDAPIWAFTLVVGLAALLGLGVSRAIESLTDALNRRPATGRPSGTP